jgi:hypothetical protein
MIAIVSLPPLAPLVDTDFAGWLEPVFCVDVSGKEFQGGRLGDLTGDTDLLH